VYLYHGTAELKRSLDGLTSNLRLLLHVRERKARCQRPEFGAAVETIHPKRHTCRHVAENGKGGLETMANHLTPTELARESGLERRDVISKCLELGVPIFNGRIDKTLFLSSLQEFSGSSQQAQVASA
jgi:hypothetical protein